MAVNIHITIIELNALHTKRQNLFQELDAVIHLLMEAKHWGLRKSRNATSLNSRFKSLDTLKVKIISVTFRRVIRTNTQGKREQFSGFNRTLDAINNVFRKFSAFHDETGRLNVDGMNIISNDGSNKLNRSRKARVSYKVQRTINASLNAATSTRAVSSNPNFVTRQKIEIIFG